MIMWTVTADSGSLLSVVKFNATKAPAMARRHGALDEDQTYLLIRARVKQSLEYMAEALEALYLGEIEGWEKPLIDEDKTADYQYRSVVTLDEWKAFLCFEAEGITYDSHFKEALRERAPEGTNKGGIYSAAMSTWTAWSKLQPNPPYGNSWGYSSKPDCRNCGHPELKHTAKGDRCNAGWKWVGKDRIEEAPDKGCACTKYEAKWPDCTCGHPEQEHTFKKVEEPGKTYADEHCMHAACECLKYNAKQVTTSYSGSAVWCECSHASTSHKYLSSDKPRGECYGYKCDCKHFKERVSVPALPPGGYVKSAEESASVFLGGDLTDEQLEEIDEIAAAHRAFAVDDEFADTYDVETQSWHKQWCPVFDGDSCICTEQDPDFRVEADWEGVITVTKPAVPDAEVRGHVDPETGAWQEHAPPGESPRAKKARFARNKRARRAARRAREEVKA